MLRANAVGRLPVVVPALEGEQSGREADPLPRPAGAARRLRRPTQDPDPVHGGTFSIPHALARRQRPAERSADPQRSVIVIVLVGRTLTGSISPLSTTGLAQVPATTGSGPYLYQGVAERQPELGRERSIVLPKDCDGVTEI